MRFGMVRPLREQHISRLHTTLYRPSPLSVRFQLSRPAPRAAPQEFCMRKEALRLAAALLPAVIYLAAAPAGTVFA
jgi:hypothetical protein